MPSAVVIGSGPNGLAGAVALARAGLDVVVNEAAEEIGGGARTGELTLPGVRHDLCSAVHPLGRASPFFRELDLDIDWVDPPVCAAHPFDDGSAAVLERAVAATARSLGPDAAAYGRLITPLVRAWRHIEPVVVGPYPPTVGVFARLARALGVARTPAAVLHGL